jgi:hypothetical protein
LMLDRLDSQGPQGYNRILIVDRFHKEGALCDEP